MKKGDKVTYTPTGEKGIIKEIPTHSFMKNPVYVVFNCGNNWENYENYTAALCNENNLTLGW